MNISEINKMLETLPQADFTEMMRMELQLRLARFRDEWQEEAEAEAEAAQLDVPEPTVIEGVVSPVDARCLLGVTARSAHLGKVTHYIISQQVFLEM